LAQLAVPEIPASKAQSERPAPKAASRLELLAQLAVPAKSVRKARSAQRVPKAPLVW
jgi:hypothetical protein